MGRLIQADRRATLTEITTRYNRCMCYELFRDKKMVEDPNAIY